MNWLDFPSCRYHDDCGARKKGKCTILTDTHFKSGECSFYSPKLESPVDEAIRLYNLGEDIKDIAEDTGLTRNAVFTVIRDAMLKGEIKATKKNRTPPELIRVANEMRQRGCTYEEIGEKIGRSPTTLSDWHRKGLI